MYKSLIALAFVLAASGFIGSANSAFAQTDNRSCIVDAPQSELRVLRDCENAYVATPPEPPVYVPLTPSEIPMIGPHDGGRKSDRPDRDRPRGGSDGNGNGSGPNGAN
jgi:hypothetical protein